MRFIRKLFTRRCAECGEVRVMFWRVRCDFCDEGEGKVKT